MPRVTKGKPPLAYTAQTPPALTGKDEPCASPLEVEHGSMGGVRSTLGSVPQLLHPEAERYRGQKSCLRGFINFG